MAGALANASIIWWASWHARLKLRSAARRASGAWVAGHPRRGRHFRQTGKRTEK